MNINAPLWMHAMETQLNAHETIRRMFGNDRTGMAAEHGFEVDRVLLPHAVPFAWSQDSTEAAWAASAGVPDDTVLNRWNLETDVVWWYFETPLPVQTLELNELGLNDAEGKIGVRALCFGWVNISGRMALAVSAWCDSFGRVGPRVLLTPSQTWTWMRDTSVAEVVTEAGRQHARLYGPGGKWHNRPQVGDKVMKAALEYSLDIALVLLVLGLALLGMAWGAP